MIFNYLKEEESSRTTILLTNIVNLSSPNTSTISDVFSEEALKWILNTTFKSSDCVFVSNLFKLLYALLLQIDYNDYYDYHSYYSDDEYDSLQNIRDFFKKSFNRIVDFSLSDRQFRCNKGSAVSLASRMIVFVEPDKKVLEEFFDYMFELMLSNPLITAVHNGFIKVFNACKEAKLSLSEFNQRCNVKVRIAKLFRKKREVLANYWGHLHVVTEAFVASEEFESFNCMNNTETDISDGYLLNSDNDNNEYDDYLNIDEIDSCKDDFVMSSINNFLNDQDIIGDFDDVNINDFNSPVSDGILKLLADTPPKKLQQEI